MNNQKDIWQKQITQIVLRSKQKPYFEIKTVKFSPSQDQTIIKVLYFSIDPVMRVWLSGARTNFRKCSPGDVFNCFGLGKVLKVSEANKEIFKVGNYVFGNTGTTQYLSVNQQKIKQLFVIPTQLVEMSGQQNFLYLFNNGIAAYAGVRYIQPNIGQTVLVSTAAGATGLLVCHLLLNKKVNVLALTSNSKIQPFKKIFPQIQSHQIIDYKTNKPQLIQFFKKNKFQGYFDNVGQQLLDLALQMIDKKGRISLCGAISNYQNYKNTNRGLRNFQLIREKSLKVYGVNFKDIISEASEIFQVFKGANLKIKKIQMKQFPRFFSQILESGGNVVGKVIVKIQ